MRSLRSRLTFTHALVALVAVLIVALLVTVLIRLMFERQRGQINQQQIQLSADAMAERLGELYAQRGSWAGVEIRLRQQYVQAPPGSPLRRMHFQLFDSRGQLIFDSAFPGGRRQGPPIADGVDSQVVAGDQTVGKLVFEVPRGALTAAERAFLFGVYLSIAVGSALAGLVALAVGSLITRHVTRPLRALKDAARRLAGGARHEPLALPPDAELAELASAFNSMAAELERQQLLRRQLVADIAHELRTPLSVLRVQIESLEDGIEQPTPATLASLSEEVGLLTRLVDDLRLLSLADAGQLSLSIGDVDAPAAAERVVRMAAARARQQGVDLRAELPDEPLTVVADPQRLAQVLGNLVENALRYTPSGGTIVVRVYADHRPPSTEARAEQLAVDQPGQSPTRSSTHALARSPGPRSVVVRQSSVVFEVADTGPGIPPDELPQIFERFYRADKTRARETGGSGLGLAIVQRLVEMQGGRIWASSAVGRGATFHVALPATLNTYTQAPLADGATH
jgi:signal transduction histidine kinase